MRMFPLLFLLLTAFAVAGCSNDDTTTEATGTGDPADEYYCPMHPEVRAAAKGTCPKCKMDLVQEGDEASHGAAPAESSDAPEEPTAPDEAAAEPAAPDEAAAEPAGHDHSEH